MSVPFVDLKAQYQSIHDQIEAALAEVCESCRFVGGPIVEAFEAELAQACGAKHAVGVGNGTDALQLALRACGIGPGDEVITQALTFTATAEAIVNAGARPVFVDVDQTYTMDPNQVADKITSRTKALLPVHLYGQPADIDPLLDMAEQHGLVVVEDAAQAHGARYKGRRVGSLGHIACFSFYPSKPLGAYGDGGAILTDNDLWAKQVRIMCDHGRSGYYQHEMIGCNSRLDALQAAVLRVKLQHLDEWNEARLQVALRYAELLASSDLILPYVAPEREHVYHLYVVRSRDRDGLHQHLLKAGIGVGLHYPAPLHLQSAYSFLGYRRGSFAKCEEWAGQILSLPMYAELTASQVAEVAAAIRSF